jgi:hypothetical protein
MGFILLTNTCMSDMVDLLHKKRHETTAEDHHLIRGQGMSTTNK